MTPLLLSGHERGLTQVKFNRDGDLLFTTSKDHVICMWQTSNGERLGTFHGHQGALWSVDADPSTTLIASGGSDNTMRLWNIATGQMLYTWDFPTAIKRVEFSPDGSQLLCVMEQRSDHIGAIYVFDVNMDNPTQQTKDHRLQIVCSESEATVAGFSYASKWIIACHEDGSISQYDAATGELVDKIQAHDRPIIDLQWAPDRTYFITASRDKTAKLISAADLAPLKTYVADAPLNSAAISPGEDFVLVGGYKAAMDVTTTGARRYKFDARFYHKVSEQEIGRVRAHFGPLNCVAVHPQGTAYCSGGEDGYVCLHHFDGPYHDSLDQVEREHLPANL